MLTRFLCLLSLLSAVGLVAFADGKTVTLTGNLVDKACSARVAKNDNPQAAAAGHTKNCSLMDGCAKSGFGVFADGQYLEFDEKGSAMAKVALEKSAKSKGAQFKVTGKVTDKKMTVESIVEIP